MSSKGKLIMKIITNNKKKGGRKKQMQTQIIQLKRHDNNPTKEDKNNTCQPLWEGSHD